MIAIKKLLFCFLLSCVAITFAGDAPSPSAKFWPSDKEHLRTAVRHIEGGGIGYNHGYTTFEGFFAPNPRSWNVLPFLDLRGHVFNDGTAAANMGIGARTIAGCRVYGLNAYYDYRNTRKINYNQVGFGLETLGRRWDFRLNGYLPVGKKITAPFNAKFNGFLGHNMMLCQKYEFAMSGANAEFGVHFANSRFFEFYAAAGTYYFAGKLGPKIWGGKARLTGRFKDYITLELSNSYDKMFHNRFQCQLTFTLPFGGESRASTESCNPCKNQNALYSRMVQPVVRQEINVVGNEKKRAAAIDPTTCQPYNFVFVNNTSSSLGTYESPYPTLALAQANSKAGDIIYVFAGDGTTKGMDAGITLQNNQKFWGSGIKHALQTTQGNFFIPAQTASAPKMTNPAGSGITLASNNQISGFTISDVFENGIFGANVENVEISDCTIDHTLLSNQIHLEYRGASGTANLHNLTLTNGSSKSIFIDSTANSTVCTIHNCIIQDNIDSFIDASFTNKARFDFKNNTIERNGNGSVINFNGPSTFTATGNTFSNNTSINIAPLLITAGTSPLSATINNNTIQDNVCGAVHFVLNNTDAAQLTVSKNVIENNGIGSIGSFGSPLFMDLNSTVAANCQLHISDNTFSSNTGSPLYSSNGSFNNYVVNASGNTLTNNGGGLVFANGCNTFTLAATDNVISNGGDHGITTAGVTLTTAHMTISNNQISNNTNLASGIALGHEGTDLNLVVTNNDISNNETSAIIMYSSNVIENVAVNIASNTINNNQNASSNVTGGVDLEQFTNLTGSIANNTFSNNVGAGVYINSAVASPSVCLDMRGNTSDTGYTVSSGTGTFNLAPCTVDTINTGAITTIGTVTVVQSCPEAVPCV